MSSTTNSAGQTVEAVPIREVVGMTTTDELGRVVPVLAVRYVDEITSTDEMGRPVDAMPVVEADGFVTTDSAGKPVSVQPVRVVAGLVTTDETGRTVPVVPVFDVGGDTPEVTPAIGKIAVVGDSLMVGLPDSVFTGLGITFQNFASGGAIIGTSSDIAAGTANSFYGKFNAIIAYAPQTLFVQLAANDLTSASDAAAYDAKLYQACLDLQALCPSLMHLVFGTIAPVDTTTPGRGRYGTDYNVRRGVVNGLWRARVGSTITAIVPMGEHPVTGNDTAAQTLANGGSGSYEVDGLHPEGSSQAVTDKKNAISDVFAAWKAQEGLPPATSPDAFTLGDVSSAPLGSTQVSRKRIQGLGIGQAADCVVSGDGGGAFGRGYGSIDATTKPMMAGDILTAVMVAAETNSTTKSTTYSIGATSDTWDITSEPPAPLVLTAGASALLTSSASAVKTITVTAPGKGRPIIMLRQTNTTGAPSSVTVQVNGTGPNHTCTLGPNNGAGHTGWMGPAGTGAGAAGDTWVFTVTYAVSTVTNVFYGFAAIENMSATGGWGSTFRTATTGVQPISQSASCPVGTGNLGVSWASIIQLQTKPASLNGQTLIREDVGVFAANFSTMWCTSASTWTAAFSHGSVNGSEYIFSFELVK